MIRGVLLLLAVALLSGPACAQTSQTTMAPTPVSALMAASTPGADDLLPLSQACTGSTTGYCSHKATLGQLAGMFGSAYQASTLLDGIAGGLGTPQGGRVMGALLMSDAATGFNVLNNCNYALSQCDYDPNHTALGAQIEFCSATNCPIANSDAHLTTHMYAQDVRYMTTVRGSDGINGGQEQALAINMFSKTGYTNNESINDGKTALSVANRCMVGSGGCWGAAFDVVFDYGRPTNIGGFVLELDASNNQGADCYPGACLMANLFIGGGGTHKMTANIFTSQSLQGSPSGQPQSVYGWLAQGDGAISDSLIRDALTADYGYNASNVHNVATFNDSGTGQYGVHITGAKSVASLAINNTAPESLSIGSTNSLAAIDTTTSTTPNALLAAANQKICLAGLHWCVRQNSSSGRLEFLNGSDAVVASLDASGNWRTAGSQTGNTTP